MSKTVIITLLFVTTASVGRFPANGQDTFSTQQVITGLADPYSLSGQDLNGDGLGDIAVVNQASREMFVYLANPQDGFSPPSTYYIGWGCPVGIVASDLNRDNICDLAATWTPSYVSVFLGEGNGQFASPSQYSVGYAPYRIVAEDLNNDNRVDLVTTNHEGGSITVLYALESGGYVRSDYAVGNGPWNLATNDFNRDGQMDVVVTNEDDCFFTVLYGTADGELGNRLDQYIEKGCLGVVAADFNRDNLPDVAASHQFSDSIIVNYGLPDGGFGNTRRFSTGDLRPNDLEIADFDDDGLMDLATTLGGEGSTKIGVMYGQPDGGFTEIDEYEVGKFPICLVAGDFNGDRLPDLAVSNYSTDTISVLYNIIPEPTTLSLLAVGVVALIRRRRK